MLTKNAGTWNKTNISTSVSSSRWVAFGQDNNNELYILSNPLGNGQVYKIKQGGGLSTNSLNTNVSFSIVPNPTSNRMVTLTFLKSLEVK